MQHPFLDAAPKPRARTIVLDLVGRVDRPAVTTAAVIRAGAAFGIEPTGMRTAIARLRADGRLVQVERGVYTCGPEAEPIAQRLQKWRDVVDRRVAWDGGWLLAVTGAPERADRTAWRRTIRAFELEGFDEVEANLWMRPDNRTGGANAARTTLADLGAVPSLFVARVEGIDEPREVRLRSKWRAAPEEADYAALTAALADHGRRSAEEPIDILAATTLTLGREAIRRIIRDPLRPDTLGGVETLRMLVEEMKRYDVIGQAAWQAYLD